MGLRVIDSALRHEMAAVAEQAGCELLDVQFAGSSLRLVVDRPEGVTLSDCEAVSRQVSALLDTVDFGPSRYVLEVSSPGLDRPLYGPRDYRRFTGRLARVTWRGPQGKRSVVGRLEEFSPDGGGRVTVSEERTRERHVIAIEDIEAARLEIEV